MAWQLQPLAAMRASCTTIAVLALTVMVGDSGCIMSADGIEPAFGLGASGDASGAAAAAAFWTGLIALAAMSEARPARIEDPDHYAELCTGAQACETGQVLNCTGKIDACRCWCKPPRLPTTETVLR